MGSAVTPSQYSQDMATRKLWTAAEMEKLSRAEQQAIFEKSVVADLGDVPAEFLAKVRADAQRLIASRESQPTD